MSRGFGRRGYIPDGGIVSIGSGSAVIDSNDAPVLAGSSVVSRSVRLGVSVEAEDLF